MIKWIIISLIGLLILSYLGFDLRKTIKSPTTKNNFEFAKELSIKAWNNFLKTPITFVWREVIVKFIWTPIKNFLYNKLQGNNLGLKEMNLSASSTKP